MKAVLISIRPKWCELIASGKKTVEVRKTRPQIETPFKVYIYCTQAKKPIYDDISESIAMYEDDLALTNRWGQGKCVQNPCGMLLEGEMFLNGKVIGEFVCDRIYDITPHYDKPDFCNQYLCNWCWGEGTACLSFTEMNDYLKGKSGYGWHISNLVIYDKPKALSEFYQKCKSYDKDEWDIDNLDCIDCENPCGNGGKLYLKRPPQSWCYVEKA